MKPVNKQSLPGFSSIFIGNHATYYDWQSRTRKGGKIIKITEFPAGHRLYFADGTSCLEQDLDYESDAVKALKRK